MLDELDEAIANLYTTGLLVESLDEVKRKARIVREGIDKLLQRSYDDPYGWYE